MHSQVHRIPYPFSFQSFLCTAQAKKPRPACIGLAGFGFDRQSPAGAKDRLPTTRVHNLVQTTRHRGRFFSNLYGHVPWLDGSRDVHNFAAAERPDPADRIEERRPVVSRGLELCAGRSSFGAKRRNRDSTAPVFSKTYTRRPPGGRFSVSAKQVIKRRDEEEAD